MRHVRRQRHAVRTAAPAPKKAPAGSIAFAIEAPMRAAAISNRLVAPIRSPDRAPRVAIAPADGTPSVSLITPASRDRSDKRARLLSVHQMHSVAATIAPAAPAATEIGDTWG